MKYRPHEQLIAPAHPSSNPLRLIAGIVLLIAVAIPLIHLFSSTVLAILGPTDKSGQTPLSAALLLFEFACLIAALFVTLKTLHKRTVFSLIGPAKVAFTQFRACILYLLPLYILVMFLPGSEEYTLTKSLAFGAWLSWLPIALTCIFIQVGAEELIFRGYLQSQLAARFRHPLIWIGIPSTLFGLVHYSEILAGENAWMLVFWATLFGVVTADLTARSGTLGPAVALHFINNVFAILISAPKGELDGLALYTYPLALDTPGLPLELLPFECLFLLCGWLTVRIALRV